MSETYEYPPSAVLPIPDSGHLDLVRTLDDGSIATIKGWSHFYDHSQDPKFSDGSGINHPFPSYRSAVADSQYNTEWWITSGVVQSYGSDARLDLVNADESGILHFKGQVGQFSLTGTKPVPVDFNLFQPYIHHGHDGREPEEQFEIPYVSDYIISVPYLPYPY